MVNISPRRFFSKKKGKPKIGVVDQNKRRGTETGINTIAWGPNETNSATGLVAIALFKMPVIKFY
mgnify:CR=1 FL=1